MERLHQSIGAARESDDDRIEKSVPASTCIPFPMVPGTLEVSVTTPSALLAVNATLVAAVALTAENKAGRDVGRCRIDIKLRVGRYRSGSLGGEGRIKDCHGLTVGRAGQENVTVAVAAAGPLAPPPKAEAGKGSR